MNGKTIALLSLFAVLSVAGALYLVADDSDAAPIDKIEGIVGEVGDTSTVAAPNVKVSVYKAGTPPILLGEDTTDDAGKFSITIDEDSATALVIKFEKDGCGVFLVPAGLARSGGGDYFGIDISKFDISTGVCTLSDDLEHCVLVSDANVQISITVTGSENRLLKGASVTLYQDGVKKYSGETDEYGVCITTSKLPVGNYMVELKCDGYTDMSEEITVNKMSAPHILTMQEKEIPTYMGITTYHILMLSGVALGIILAIIAYMLCRRNWSRVEND
ncbi:MAG: carboxypeptidase-like regulatory domain-containing protein [archaeon]|nr:carboxypeptidase-like regulatory domain-containing protein [archaeon]